MRRERLFANRAIALSGGATADSARTRLRAIGRLSSKSNSLKEDIEVH